jgi:RNA polymerase sigma-70 factor, ECF subfamily
LSSRKQTNPGLRLVPPGDTSERPLSERDDDALMLLSRSGRSDAFDALVCRHEARVLGVAAKYMGSVAAAKDIAQCTFLEIYRALPQYQPRGKFAAYLYRVLLNQCRMAWRSKRYEERAWRFAISEADERMSDDQLLERERRRQVERLLALLSEKLRAVIVLRFGGDLSYEEIATTLEIPLGTVKRRLFDGLAKLRDLMEEA